MLVEYNFNQNQMFNQNSILNYSNHSDKIRCFIQEKKEFENILNTCKKKYFFQRNLLKI